MVIKWVLLLVGFKLDKLDGLIKEPCLDSPKEVVDIVEYEIPTGYQYQRNSRGKKDTEAETYGHRGELLCLPAFL